MYKPCNRELDLKRTRPIGKTMGYQMRYKKLNGVKKEMKMKSLL